MFRITTYNISDLEKEGTPVPEELAHQFEFRGFDHNDALEGHMASYVEFLIRDGERWTELQPQLEWHDRGNSHMPMLATYLRMLSEFRRIMEGRKRGVRRLDYLLSLEELERIADAQVPPLPPDTEELTDWKPWLAQSPASSAPNATASSRMPSNTSMLRSTMSGS